jgi:hypothetical protein
MDALAIYNSERSRGIVHTREWVLQMAELQQQFDSEQLERLFREADRIGGGVYQVPGGGYLVSPKPLREGWIKVERQ